MVGCIWTPRKSLFVQSFSLYFGPCSTHIHTFLSSHPTHHPFYVLPLYGRSIATPSLHFSFAILTLVCSPSTVFIHPVHSSSYIWTPRKSVFVQSFSLYFGPCSTHTHSFYFTHSYILFCHTYTSLYSTSLFIHPVHSSSYIWTPRKSLSVQSFSLYFGPCSVIPISLPSRSPYSH